MKKLFLITTFIFLSVLANAKTVVINNIYYNLIENGSLAQVTQSPNNYTGEIVIPESVTYEGKTYSVTKIASYAFKGCDNLTSIKLPNSITDIGKGAFEKCTGLSSIIIPNSVKTIGEAAFSSCNITTISLPNSITSIEAITFWGCIYLNSIVIPNSVTSIGTRAFSNCKRLISVTLSNSLVEMGEAVFEDCTLLESIALPNGIKKIPMQTFWECKGLESVTLPNSLETIDYSAFYYCSKLKSIFIPNSVKVIGSYAFGYCQSLIDIGLPAHLTSIGSNAFSGCNSLETIDIPNSVYIIGEKAFEYCRKLARVNSEIESPFEISDDVFQYISSNAVLQVPQGTKSEYEAYSGWIKNFKDIVEQGGGTSYTLSIKATGNGTATYDGITIRNKTNIFNVNEGSTAWITFAPDNGYRIKSVKVNNADVTSSVSNNSYTISDISRDTNVEVEFEAIPPTTYTLSITASGNGSASYNGTSIRSKTSTFTVNEGTNVSITFTPDNGYRIKSVKENNTIVTSYVSNNTYKINSISRNTTVEVEFEAIPQTTYTLTIAVSGGGSVYYEGETINNSTNYYTVNDGTYATIYFTPDDGYRLKSVKENYYDVTSQIGSNSYTTYISGNTSIEVEFEEISVSTYSLSVKASGSGSVSYNGSTVRNRTTSFTVEEGTNATITFTPDNGYRLKSVVVNNYNVTSSVSNNSYTISYINRDTNVEVEFEAIPATTYTLSVKAVGSGSASYNGTIVRDKTSMFSVNEGTNATIAFTPDNGYRIKSLMVNSANETVNISNNTYTISNISRNTTVEVVFEEDSPKQLIDGHEYVDLDLPSGRYWSTLNYGANNPEDAGSYLREASINGWGEYWRAPTQEEIQPKIRR